MEIPYVVCINCGKPIGHLYSEFRESRDSGRFDETALKKVDRKLPKRSIDQFKKEMARGEILERALSKIGVGRPEQVDDFIAYRNELNFEHHKLRRYCCRNVIINPAIVAQQVTKIPVWSNLLTEIDSKIHRILDMRGHTLNERGIHSGESETGGNAEPSY